MGGLYTIISEGKFMQSGPILVLIIFVKWCKMCEHEHSVGMLILRVILLHNADYLAVCLEIKAVELYQHNRTLYGNDLTMTD